MKHKNVYAYLFFAATIGTGNSAWAMKPNLSPEELWDSTAKAIIKQFEFLESNLAKFKDDAAHQAELEAHALQARKEALAKIKGPWHAQKSFAAKTGQDFVSSAAAHAGATLGQGGAESICSMLFATPAAQKRMVIAQAQQNEIVTLASVAKLKEQQYTDEEYFELVLLNNPQLARRYEVYSDSEEFLNSTIKAKYSDFDAQSPERQSEIKEFLANQIEKSKKEINTEIGKLIERQKREDKLNSLRKKMAINKRIEDVTNNIARGT